MGELFRLADSSIMVTWLIDRIACGYSFEVIRSLYEQNFEQELTYKEYDVFSAKYSDEISARYDELRQQIYDSGTFAKLTKVADRLYELVNNPNEMTPRELASVSDSLRKYLETLATVGKKQTEAKQLTQNNFLLFKGLEEESLIKILNPKRLQYVVDGVIDDEV